jgi:hypothetical protein
MAPWFGKMAHDETTDLLNALLHTVLVITESDEAGRQRVANAYRDARSLMASMGPKGTPALPRIVACFERFNAYLAADDVPAAAWMLTAIQERLAERDLRDWEKLEAIAGRTAKVLPVPQKTSLH